MKRWGIALLVVGIVVIMGFGYSQAAEKPIKIGVLMNLTGPWASIDEPAWKAIQLAVDKINDSGGLLGRKVEANCIDTKADEAETVAATIRLAESGASAIIGYCDTHWVLTAAPIAREYRIPFITAGATHPRIPERTGAWLACFGDNAQAGAVAKYTTETMNLRNAAVWIDSACDFSIAVCTYFDDSFNHYGGKVVYKDYFETEWKDYSALVTRLKAQQDAGKVDFVYVGGVPGNCGLIVKQIREGGVTLPIIGEDGFDTPLLVEVAGKYAEGVIFTSHVSLEDKAPVVVNFVKAYEKKWGTKPENAFAALGYDAMGLVAEAIKKINSAEPKKVSAGLSLVREFQGVTGTVSYRPGSRVPDKSVALLKVEGGKFNTIAKVTPEYLSPPDLSK
ncbi:MAG: ABC transporter substrate-binding protein [Deltaproteobacteria bacterium]|nr:ABC transporter substrate-binding protein [Deltaproteobacteria bacterium]